MGKRFEYTNIDRVVDLDMVLPFVEKWHYLHKMPSGKNYYYIWTIPGFHYGLWDAIYAVAIYGINHNPYQARSLSKLTGLEIDATKLLELRRLCRREPKIEELPLTAFLARCHRILKNYYRYIVAYSDPEQGHNGGIYKAANFNYLGQTKPSYHVVDHKGRTIHRRSYSHYAKSKGLTLKQARKELGFTTIRKEPKDRWFLAL